MVRGTAAKTPWMDFFETWSLLSISLSSRREESLKLKDFPGGLPCSDTSLLSKALCKAFEKGILGNPAGIFRIEPQISTQPEQ